MYCIIYTEEGVHMNHIFGKVIYYLHLLILNTHKDKVTAECNFIQDIQGTNNMLDTQTPHFTPRRIILSQFYKQITYLVLENKPRKGPFLVGGRGQRKST